MRTFGAGIALTAILLYGCSKKEAAPAAVDTAPAAGSKSAAAVGQKQDSNPMVEAALADLEKKVQAKQYEAAVGSLVTLKEFPKSEKEQEAYNRQMRATIDALSARANQGDEAARASQQMLGRMMTGR